MNDPRGDDTLSLLRDSLRRFVDREIVPKAQAWEAQGFVPREVLRQMGGLGFLGLRYAEEFGGGALDARATALLAEELGRSTFGGFGFIRESAIERMYRDARVQSIGGGATEVMLEEVAQRL